MRKVLLGIAALLIVGEFLAAAPPRRRATRKVRVGDPAVARELLDSGARLLADYGSFQILEADPARVAPLIHAGRAEARDEEDLVLLSSRPLDTQGEDGRALARTMIERFSGRRLHLVQLAGPVKPEWYAALERTGAEVVTYIPHNTYLVYGDEEHLGRVRALGAFVQWQGPLTSEDRIHPRARDGARARGAAAAGEDLYAVQLVADPPTNEITSRVIDALRRGEVLSRYRILRYENVIVRLDPAQLATLAERPDVVSIQPYVIPRMRDEKQGQIVAGALSGTGPTGPGYLSFLSSKGFTQAQFTASGFAVDVTDSGVDNGTTAPNHFGLYAGGLFGGLSRVVYNRLEGFPLGGQHHPGLRRARHAQRAHHRRLQRPHGVPLRGRRRLRLRPRHRALREGGLVRHLRPDLHVPQLREPPVARPSRRRAHQLEQLGVRGQRRLQRRTRRPTTRSCATRSRRARRCPAAGNQEMVIVFAAGNDGPVRGHRRRAGHGQERHHRRRQRERSRHSAAPTSAASTTWARTPSTTSSLLRRAAPPPTAARSRTSSPPARTSPAASPSRGHAGGRPARPAPASTAPASAAAPGPASSPTASSSTPRLPAPATPRRRSPAAPRSSASTSSTAASAPPSPAMTKAFLMNAARYMTGADANDTLPSNNQGMGLMDLGHGARRHGPPAARPGRGGHLHRHRPDAHVRGHRRATRASRSASPWRGRTRRARPPAMPSATTST